MGKQETLGFILIGMVLLVWMWMSAPPPVDRTAVPGDTAAVAIDPGRRAVDEQMHEETRTAPSAGRDSLGRYFAHLAGEQDRVLFIKTDLYTAQVTTRGGQLRKWELSTFKTWNGYPVQMIDPSGDGDFGMVFVTSDGKEVRTSSLQFNADYVPGTTIELTEDRSHTVTFTLPISESQRIVKKLTFQNGSYTCRAEMQLQNLSTVIANYEFYLTWESGIPYAEHNSVDESGFARGFVYAGEELAEVDASSFDETERLDINGVTDWVAVCNKYFAVAMVPDSGTSQGAYVEGRRFPMPDQGAIERYSLNLKMPFRGKAVENVSVKLFLGPLDFDVVKSAGKDLEQLISLGAWIIRPISEYVMIPLFRAIHFFIPNFGIVIIVFSIIIKIALHPLSKSSMKSMRKMQALQPMMTEIREKHKDDPQKMNQAMMNLYKDYGVNPASGCLPLILQMPILFALYSVFRSAIELRQASFFWWITDLSIPDVAFELPFSLPLVGMKTVSGLALAMGITMFIQQKMTVTDPRQKAMVWMMPIMMTILFNGLPSGLNLYYFVFNLLSIGQQVWLKKSHPEEPLRKVERKKTQGGLLGRLTRDLPKVKR
jgi:YidC/Oxa1 family membrane protein insertase